MSSDFFLPISHPVPGSTLSIKDSKDHIVIFYITPLQYVLILFKVIAVYSMLRELSWAPVWHCSRYSVPTSQFREYRLNNNNNV